MPFPIAAVVAGGAALLGQGINAGATQANNKRQEAFSREMYEKQRLDNEKQWHMNNEYNSPRAQMIRLQQAGLNPNLVYSNGAANTSAPVPTASPQSISPTAPQVDLSQGMHAYNNYRLQNAQLSNMESQNTVLEQEAALKAATTASTIEQTAKTKFERELAMELRTVSADAAYESLRKIQLDNAVTIAANERAAIQNDQSIKESIARIGQIRAQTANNEQDRKRILADTQRLLISNDIAKLDLILRRNGINPSDPTYLRVLGQAMQNPAQTLQNIKNKTGDIWQQLRNQFK